MKQRKTLLAWLPALALVLLAGCGAQEDVAPTATPTTAETTPLVQETGTTVHNVDELLAAIAPDAEIVLAEGTYDLSTASDYGQKSQSAYYSWDAVAEGYELRIYDVQNLTIRGGGREGTTVCAQPRYANVLALQNCTGVRLEDFTAGHTEAPGACTGGVVRLEGCSGIELRGLGLFGCGTTGVSAYLCADVHVADCDIYACTVEGINLQNTRRASVENCRLHDLGEEVYGGYSVVTLHYAKQVEIAGCEVSGNDVSYLVECMDCEDVTLKDNAFADNWVSKAAFCLYGPGPVLDGNTFTGREIRSWFDGFDYTLPTDVEGRELTQQVLKETYAASLSEPSEEARTEVHVSTVDELLAAIAPNTEIILDEKMYDLSTASDYGTGETEYYLWVEEFDGPELMIRKVSNLCIRGGDGDEKAHVISAQPRYADVLSFYQCDNVTLAGFTAGHTKEPGECAGGVLELRSCDQIRIEGCGLFGCGILGVRADGCAGLTVTGCDIYECSQGGIWVYNSQDIAVDQCTFRDLGGEKLFTNGCENVTIDGKAMP